MDKFKRAIPSVMLSVMLVFGMFAGLSDFAYADTDDPSSDLEVVAKSMDTEADPEIACKLGVKEEIPNINPTEADDYYVRKVVGDYASLTPYDAEITDYTIQTNIPVAGSLIVVVAYGPGTSCDVRARGAGGQNVISGGDIVSSNGRSYLFNVSSEGPVIIDITLYGRNKSAEVIPLYAAAEKEVSADTPDFILGSTGYGAASTVKVKVPATGYLSISAINEINTGYSVSYNTNGFKSWEYRSGGAPITIGVKKGTYTISLKDAQCYGMAVKFTKVKETSAKTSKKKAAKIKKGKTNKGIIAVNSKKVHWYKIKNPKNQKINFNFNAAKMSGGGSGSVRITAYFPNGKKESVTARPGYGDTFYLRYGRVGSKKAMPGTYYLKVESKGGANGYYKLKWK